MAEVRRDLWSSPGPIPLLNQGHLQQVVQDHVQMSFGYFQGDTSNLKQLSLTLLYCDDLLQVKLVLITIGLISLNVDNGYHKSKKKFILFFTCSKGGGRIPGSRNRETFKEYNNVNYDNMMKFIF